ncbi:hypothetical protein KXD40_003857 [Peronospora effusa]|uniref:Rab-GAP TBC domain-containing protein n=1 Tax=Peronospora effusa TaxID=542832 RepID=A0A3M6V6V8_9STRA|nr:hypothetical protein DD238_007847 [Peronospora effusa]UIZ23082.1 hypothetical protein KXD40_003857 [Peronospora effusa]
MLQGLRKKIGRYASVGGVEETLEEEGRQKQRLKEDATPMEAAVWHFNKQDRTLRRLETEMIHMLDKLRVAFVSMATVAEMISEICSIFILCFYLEFVFVFVFYRCFPSDKEKEKDYVAAMKQIEQEDTERMEQSIRFTILDPMQARLERYDQLRKEIHNWDKLRAGALKMHVSRFEDDEKRLHLKRDLYTLLQEAEEALLPQLEDAIRSEAVTTAALFKTTRLQTAIFFRNASRSVQSSLTLPEQELVVEANRAFKYSAAMNVPLSSKSLSLASDGWSEVDGSSSSTALDGVEAISGSDEDDESNVLSITFENIAAGRVLRTSKSTEVGAERQRADKLIVTPASCPMIRHDGDDEKEVRGKDADGEQSNKPLCSTSLWPRTATLKPATPRRTTTMLTSIRKTLWGKLSYASGETRMIRQSSASITTSASAGQGVDSQRKVCTAFGLFMYYMNAWGLTYFDVLLQCDEELHIIPQSSKEWLVLEDCLWDLDMSAARSPGNPLLQTDLISYDADDILSRLLQEVCSCPMNAIWYSKLTNTVLVDLQDDSLCSECLSYLRIEDLARLTKVNFRLHSRLVDSAPIWKKCIRSGGLSPAIRSSLWLSVFYESTPWRSSAIVSHYLSADRRRSMYDQLLTKEGTRLADEVIGEGPSSINEDAQLAIWFREIDVDVVRTCHRTICAKVMPRTFSTMPTAADNEDSIESILKEMVNTIVRTEKEDTSLCDSYKSPSTNFTSVHARNLDLEAKMRRVLRAYVVYNPRVGYCQGMGFLVRLLAEVADDEADIFWLFVGFSEPENDQNLYEPGMAVLQPYLSKFELLLSIHMPKLFSHFQAEGVHVAAFCTRWFLTFFSSFEALAPTLVTRLLDIFIIDGWRIMFSFSLVILDELQKQLLKCDMEGILRILQFPRSYMPEPDQLRQQQLVRHALAFSVTRAMNSI